MKHNIKYTTRAEGTERKASLLVLLLIRDFIFPISKMKVEHVTRMSGMNIA